MVEINCITLNGKEYAIIENVCYNNNDYVYLINLEDEKDILVRKVVIENNENYYCTLDSVEELDNVMLEIHKKLNKKYP